MVRSTRVLLVVPVIVAALATSLAIWFLPGYLPQTIVNAVKRAESIVLYEGLPHHLYEEQLLAQERSAKAIREIGEYPFYQEHLVLNQDDVKRLVELLGSPSTWEPFSIEKPCGGFHPDYALELRQGTARWHVLICFGCGEAKVFSPWGEWRYDMSRDTKQRLYAVLTAYQKNRPPSEHRAALGQNIKEGW